jgi:hypothetical protein
MKQTNGFVVILRGLRPQSVTPKTTTRPFNHSGFTRDTSTQEVVWNAPNHRQYRYKFATNTIMLFNENQVDGAFLLPPRIQPQGGVWYNAYVRNFAPMRRTV